jgi:hypothetical protein
MTENTHQTNFLIDNFYGDPFFQLIHEPTGNFPDSPRQTSKLVRPTRAEIEW